MPESACLQYPPLPAFGISGTYLSCFRVKAWWRGELTNSSQKGPKLGIKPAAFLLCGDRCKLLRHCVVKQRITWDQCFFVPVSAAYAQSFLEWYLRLALHCTALPEIFFSSSLCGIELCSHILCFLKKHSFHFI